MNAPNYGRDAGKPLETLNADSLAFYRRGAVNTLASPDKAGFHERNRVLLSEIDRIEAERASKPASKPAKAASASCPKCGCDLYIFDTPF